MSDQSTQKVQSQQIYQRLRHAITTCELEPDSRLRVVDIAGREGVSPGAVREAISAMVSEHLVIPLPQRGFRVAPLSREDMFDLFTTRAELESRLVAEAAVKSAPEWRKAVESTFQAMLAIRDERTVEEKGASAHESFHRALVAGCGSRWSLRLFDTVYAASERYRYFAYRFLRGNRDPHIEHGEIVAAVEAGDVEHARELSRNHVLRTRDLLDEALAEADDAAQLAPST